MTHSLDRRSILLLAGAFLPHRSSTAASKKKKKPLIGSALIYSGSEVLATLGVRRIPIVYESSIFDQGNPEPNLDRLYASIDAEIVKYNPTHICLDIERWHLYTKNGSAIKENFDRYKNLIQSVSNRFPTPQFGYYGVAPTLDYWSLARDSSSPAQIANWKAKSLQAASAIIGCKTLFVPLYTFYDTPSDWIRYASHRIAMSNQIAGNRDVFYLLWPSFHEGGQYKDNRLVPIELWKTQIDFCIQNSANVMLWGGWNGITNKPDRFDPTSSWWQVVESRLPEFDLPSLK